MILNTLILNFMILTQQSAAEEITAEGLGLAGNQTGLLLQLVQTSGQELHALQNLVQSNANSAEALQRAAELSQGLRNKLDAMKGSDEYQAALMNIQRKSGAHALADDSRSKVQSKQNSKEYRESEQFYSPFREFQETTVRANQADLAELNSLSRKLEDGNAIPPGAMPRVIAQIGAKSAEVNTRVSAQFSELLDEIRSIREEIVHNKKNDEAELAQSQKKLDDTMRKLAALGMGN